MQERDRSKPGPSRHRAQVDDDDDDDEEIEQGSISTVSSYEPRPKKLKLVSEMPEELFNNEYMFVHKAKVPKKVIPVVLPKVDPPPHFEGLSDLSYADNTWTVMIPDILVAHVAGCLNAGKRDFTVDSNTDLLQDSFKLLATKVNEKPSYVKAPTSRFYEAVVQQMRGLASQWVTALHHHKFNWQDKDFLDKVVYPGVASAIKGLENTIKLGRDLCCPKYIPSNLRYRFVNAPCSAMWAEDQDLDLEMRKFFRSKRRRTDNFSKTSYRGARNNKRGQFRGRRTRGLSNRGYRRRGANRGSSDTQSRSDSNNPSTSK